MKETMLPCGYACCKIEHGTEGCKLAPEIRNFTCIPFVPGIRRKDPEDQTSRQICEDSLGNQALPAFFASKASASSVSIVSMRSCFDSQ